MTKVLLSGATGFIGRHCLPLFATGNWEVHAVSSRTQEPSQYSIPDITWHQVDLFNANEMRDLMGEVQPEYLLHLAWCSTAPGGFWTSTLNFRWVEASLQLLQEFAETWG